MASQKYWDDLMKSIDAMSDEGFTEFLDELDAMGDVPFAIEETEEANENL